MTKFSNEGTLLSSGMALTESKEAYLDPAAMEDLLILLTDMYPDADLAVVREYSSNAYDSHVEAGQTRPIEVTLPSDHDPRFIVQDWGVGLDSDGLDDCVGYGTSTKKKKKNVHGKFGLGFKSAITSVDSFQVVAVKDGIKRYAVIFKNERGILEKGLSSTEVTNEPNGVTVIIPVDPDSIESYAQKAAQLFVMWPEGSVLVNGKAPTTPLQMGYQPVSDLGWLKDERTYDSSKKLKVNMGGVLYNVDGLDYSKRKSLYANTVSLENTQVIVNVPLRSVKIAPNRESVLMDRKSLRLVQEKLEALYKYLLDNAQSEVDKAPDAFAAIERAESYRKVLSGFEFSYKGLQMPIRISVDNFKHHRWESEKSSRRLESKSVTFSIGSDKLNLKVLIIDTHKMETPSHRLEYMLTPIRRMTEGFNTGSAHFYVGDFTQLLLDNESARVFLQAMVDNGCYTVVKADEVYKAAVEANKKEYTPTERSPRSKLTYPVLVHNGEFYEYKYLTVEAIKNLTSAYYVDNVEEHDYSCRAINAIFGKYGVKGENLILVASNRKVSALESRVKNDVSLEPFASVFTDRLKNDLVRIDHTPYSFAYERISIYHGTRDILIQLGDKIHSKLLREVLNQNTEVIRERLKKNSEILRMARQSGLPIEGADEVYQVAYTSEETEAIGEKIVEAMKDYTYAWVHFSYSGPSEKEIEMLEIFVNAIYAKNGDPVL